MQLFYHPDITTLNQEIAFSKEESRHIIKVLRKTTGENLMVTNGKGFMYESEIIIENPNKCIIKIISETRQEPLPYQLHLAVAPTKLNDRYEWFLEKATEIGITEITPILCAQSERKKINTERFEKIIQSAMKQSLKTYLPKLNPLIGFSEFIKKTEHNSFTKCIAHCAENKKQPLFKTVKNQSKILVMIGPEGDFSEREIALATQHHFIPTSLGRSRLRTETAAIVACHTVCLGIED